MTNVQNGKSVIVRVNDRGPFLHNRIMDLSYAAAVKLGYLSSGSELIEVQMLTAADIAASVGLTERTFFRHFADKREVIFSGQELLRLDTEVRGYLMYLENVRILSGTQRELVIDRLMALEADEIDIEQVKWVVLMVLFSQPGQESAYAQMEDLVFEERSDALH